MAFQLSELVIHLNPLELDDTASLAATVMRQLEAPAVPLVDREGAYAGAVSIFSLIRRRAPASTKLKSLAEKVPPLEDLSDPIAVARAFVKTGFPGLPVVEGRRLLGIVSARKLLMVMNLKPRVPAGLIMYPLKPLSPNDPVDKARRLAGEIGLRIVPVASAGKLVGVVKVYDLVKHLYGTPIERRTAGEKVGEADYYLSQPVRSLMVEAQRVTEASTVPTPQDLAEGCVVTDERGGVVGVISPYLLLRRLLPVVEEAAIPLRIEGANELDFIAQRLIYVKSLDVAKAVAERARLLELSVVLKSRPKGSSVRYEAVASIKLDVGVHSAKVESWNPVEAVSGALDAVYKRFSKVKERARERRVSLERLRKELAGDREGLPFFR